MWVLAVVQGPNITMYAGNGDVRKENMGEFQKAIAHLLSTGWEPFAAGDNNLVVVWFKKKVG